MCLSSGWFLYFKGHIFSSFCLILVTSCSYRQICFIYLSRFCNCYQQKVNLIKSTPPLRASLCFVNHDILLPKTYTWLLTLGLVLDLPLEEIWFSGQCRPFYCGLEPATPDVEPWAWFFVEQTLYLIEFQWPHLYYILPCRMRNGNHRRESPAPCLPKINYSINGSCY